MHFYTLIKVNLQIKTAVLLALFLLKGHFCWTQNVLEQKSFDFLSNYLDHHKSTDTLYFEYAKAYENKAFKAHDLEKLFYIKSKYIVHGNAFSDKLAHAQQLLNLAKQQNNTRYVGLAKICFLWFILWNAIWSKRYIMSCWQKSYCLKPMIYII